MPALTRAETVRLALAELGVEESPPYSNRQKYGVWYGFNGVAWCCIFLSWVLARAENASGFRFASTASAVSWARQRHRLVPLAEVRPGDVLVHLYSISRGHAGLATESARDGTVVSVEGNTSSSSDDDGGTVMVRRRSLGWWHYCIRLDFPGPVPPTPFTPQEVSTMFETHRFVRIPGDPVRFYSWDPRDSSVYAWNGAPGPIPSAAGQEKLRRAGGMRDLTWVADVGLSAVVGEPGANSTWGTWNFRDLDPADRT